MVSLTPTTRHQSVYRGGVQGDNKRLGAPLCRAMLSAPDQLPAGLDKDAKPSKAAKRKARKERVLDQLEARGVVLDHDANCHVTQRRIEQRAMSHEVVDLCDDEIENMDSGVPLLQEAGPSTASAQVPPPAELQITPLSAEEPPQFCALSAGDEPAPKRPHSTAVLLLPPRPVRQNSQLQVRWADAAPEQDELAVACTSEYAEYASLPAPEYVSDALHPGGGRRTPEPSQESDVDEPDMGEAKDEAVDEAMDEAIDEAQFSDAEDGPPTPSAATRLATLEEENGSFALSGVVAADAWQAGG